MLEMNREAKNETNETKTKYIPKSHHRTEGLKQDGDTVMKWIEKWR